jgi:predicted AAA+ superfamily ATPase
LNHEVDFIIGDDVAIEVKSTDSVTAKHVKSLRMFCEDIDCPHRIVVSLDARPRLLDDSIQVLPWQVCLADLWKGAFSKSSR